MLLVPPKVCSRSSSRISEHVPEGFPTLLPEFFASTQVHFTPYRILRNLRHPPKTFRKFRLCVRGVPRIFGLTYCQRGRCFPFFLVGICYGECFRKEVPSLERQEIAPWQHVFRLQTSLIDSPSNLTTPDFQSHFHGSSCYRNKKSFFLLYYIRR